MRKHVLRRRPFLAEMWTSYQRRRVAETIIGHGKHRIRISTVALLSHELIAEIYGDRMPESSLTGVGPYETLVRGGALDGYRWQFNTREEARIGHASAAVNVRIVADLERKERARRRRLHTTYRRKAFA